MEALNTGSPGFVLHDKFIRTIKHFLKIMIFRGSDSVYNTILVCMQTETGIVPNADKFRAPSSAGTYHCSSIDFNKLAPVYINWGAVALCGTISFFSFLFFHSLMKNTEMSFLLVQRKGSLFGSSTFFFLGDIVLRLFLFLSNFWYIYASFLEAEW